MRTGSRGIIMALGIVMVAIACRPDVKVNNVTGVTVIDSTTKHDTVVVHDSTPLVGGAKITVQLVPSALYTLHNGTGCGAQRFLPLHEVLPVGTDQRVRWSLSKTGIVNIDTSGTITATTPQGSTGVVVVTATALADTTASASLMVVEDSLMCQTTVTLPTPLRVDSLQQPVGQVIGAPDPTLDWWTTNPSILYVNPQSGSTMGIHPGKAQVCAKPRNNPFNIPSGCSDTVTVSP